MTQTVTATPNIPANQAAYVPSNSAALERLLREVRIEGVEAISNRYDRVHNRHNR